MPVPPLLELPQLLLDVLTAPLVLVPRLAALPAMASLAQLVSHVFGPLPHPFSTHDRTSRTTFGPFGQFVIR
jgi:hypothetical protein